MSIEAWIGILVPIATGLAFLAYRHPRECEDLVFPICSFVACLLAIIGFIYNLGVFVAITHLADADKAIADLGTARKELETAYIARVYLFGLFAFGLYLVLLSWLAKHIWAKEEYDDKKEDGQS